MTLPGVTQVVGVRVGTGDPALLFPGSHREHRLMAVALMQSHPDRSASILWCARGPCKVAVPGWTCQWTHSVQEILSQP